MERPQDYFRVRTITCFVQLSANHFTSTTHKDVTSSSVLLRDVIHKAASFLRRAEQGLARAGYTVQTVRIATNSFGEWLDRDTAREQLNELDQLLATEQITFCALGPATSIEHVRHGLCDLIATNERFSCSALLAQNDVDMALECARTIQRLSHVVVHDDASTLGLCNFRFAVAAAMVNYIPYFPVASAAPALDGTDAAESTMHFAIGLENGELARHLLEQCGSIRNIPTVFGNAMSAALLPLQESCRELGGRLECNFVGIDTSLNPSLEARGSVAAAMECLAEVTRFGGPGTLAAAATITQTLQSLPGIQHCGYAGLMLPVCEDQRLAELCTDSSSPLAISTLLSISQVCGVGVDTVPVPGDVTETELASLLLDVAGVAHRWNKCLSCRIFPVVGKRAGEVTSFQSPYLINAHILPL